MQAMRRQSISAVIAAVTVIGLPTANAVAAVTANPPSSASAREKARAAAAKAAAAKAAQAKAAAAKAAAAKAATAAKGAATTTAATPATTPAPVSTTPDGRTIGPPLDIMPAPAKARLSAPTGEHTYVGNPVEMDQWGPVTVTIVVDNGKIIESTADMPLERPRSSFINTRVEPYLNAQALKLQNAKLDLIGGATRTCIAYAESLQSAIDKAGIRR